MIHRVEQGECLSSIANRYGFADYRTIYDDPGNAEFKKKRPNPNVIYPGDALVIPDKKDKAVDCATGSKHQFRLKTQRPKLRLKLEDDQGNAYGDKKYTLTIDDETFEGKTGSDGLLEHVIPADARKGELIVFLAGEGDGVEGYTFPLELGHLDPPDTPSGAHSRLRNLAYESADSSDTPDAEVEEMLRAFQENNGLPASGALDDLTAEKLRQMHDE